MMLVRLRGLVLRLMNDVMVCVFVNSTKLKVNP